MPPRTWLVFHFEALQWPSPPSLAKTILIYKWKSHVPWILSLLSRPRQMDNTVSWSSDSLSLSFGKTVIFQNGSWIRKPGGLVSREQDMNKYILPLENFSKSSHNYLLWAHYWSVPMLSIFFPYWSPNVTNFVFSFSTLITVEKSIFIETDQC